MPVRPTPSAAEITAGVAVAPPADAAQDHVFDEIEHPKTCDAFERMLLTPSPAPDNEQPETD